MPASTVVQSIFSPSYLSSPIPLDWKRAMNILIDTSCETNYLFYLKVRIPNLSAMQNSGAH